MIQITVNPTDRLQLSTTIERLIELLDAVDGDADFEPNLGANENHPVGSWMWDRDDSGSQLNNWSHAGDDREEEDENGGDINDEPHDDNELDACDGDYDQPGFIPGGQGL